MSTLAPGAARLAAVHARYLAVETLRVPIAVVGTVMFPVLSMLFFVVPFAEVSGDPVAATAATAQLSLFAVFSVCLFTFGVGVADDRSTPWEPYVRTLPVGAGPRVAARLLTGVLFALLGLLPLLLVAALATEAAVTPGQVVLGLGALAAAGTPLLLMGIAIGYALPVKAAIPAAQVLLFPLAFGGGLFLPPQSFPGWLDGVSLLLPTRAGRDLVVAATTGGDVPGHVLPVLLVWTAVTAAVAVWAYRRDEGRRFR
ncbi:ABC transporter permease [Aquipuribacter sp. SD81]|uniref:ABC transporter permease n=1 Tax=Aquipuribacter sp. SD81 TaxID=3127703 RepID=UPI003016C4A8